MGYDLEIYSISAEIQHSWNNVNFYSLTAYSHGEDHMRTDLMTTPIDFANEQTWNNGETFSQEFRIDNAGSDSALGWVAGVYYVDEQQDLDARTYGFYDLCQHAPDRCFNPPPFFGFIPAPSLDAAGATQIVIQENSTVRQTVMRSLVS